MCRYWWQPFQQRNHSVSRAVLIRCWSCCMAGGMRAGGVNAPAAARICVHHGRAAPACMARWDDLMDKMWLSSVISISGRSTRLQSRALETRLTAKLPPGLTPRRHQGAQMRKKNLLRIRTIIGTSFAQPSRSLQLFDR